MKQHLFTWFMSGGHFSHHDQRVDRSNPVLRRRACSQLSQSCFDGNVNLHRLQRIVVRSRLHLHHYHLRGVVMRNKSVLSWITKKRKENKLKKKKETGTVQQKDDCGSFEFAMIEFEFTHLRRFVVQPIQERPQQGAWPLDQQCSVLRRPAGVVCDRKTRFDFNRGQFSWNLCF